MKDKQYKCINYNKKEKILTIVLNRPDKLNSINMEMAMELRVALLDFEKDEDIKVGIITGSGDKAFCVGGDVSNFTKTLASTTTNYDYCKLGYDIHRLMEKIEKPIIAAINGYCIAGGLEIALACDFMIASDSSSFGLAEITIGLLAGWGGTVRLPRAIPARKAKEMIYTGEAISAQEAERVGLVNRVVPRAQLYEVVNEIANKIINKSTFALRMAKSQINYGLETPDMDAALFMERGMVCTLGQGEDAKEGVNAFLEKRSPKFK